MNDMIGHVVYTGNLESTYILDHTVYLDKEIAIKQAKEELIRKRHEDIEVYGDEIGTEMCPITKWHKKGELRWTNNIDLVYVEDIAIIE